MSENALQLCCHTAAVGSGLNESIYVLFCVVVAVVVVVVVVVECEILLSLVTAPRKTWANSGITINSKFPNLQYDTLHTHTHEIPTCMTDKQEKHTQGKYQ